MNLKIIIRKLFGTILFLAIVIVVVGNSLILLRTDSISIIIKFIHTIGMLLVIYYAGETISNNIIKPKPRVN